MDDGAITRHLITKSLIGEMEMRIDNLLRLSCEDTINTKEILGELIATLRVTKLALERLNTKEVLK